MKKALAILASLAFLLPISAQASYIYTEGPVTGRTDVDIYGSTRKATISSVSTVQADDIRVTGAFKITNGSVIHNFKDSNRWSTAARASASFPTSEVMECSTDHYASINGNTYSFKTFDRA